nr:lipid A deacylase LpxR family protein [Motiliproteus sp. SC1-56]
MGRLLALLACLAGPVGAACVADPRSGDYHRWTGNLYFENDLFAETDQNYTNGIRVSAISPNLDSFRQDPLLAPWVRSLNHHLRFLYSNREGDSCLSRRLVLTLGQTIYTPQDIDATEVVEDERPYAGWLYGGVAYHLRSDGHLESLGFNLGVVGPLAFGEQAQNFIHDLRGFKRFKGWDNQLKNEPGVQLLYEFKQKWADSGPGLGVDLIAHGGGSLGNVATYLNAGVEGRLGWNLPDDFGTSAVRPGSDNSAPDSAWDPRGPERWGWHLFVSSDVRLVLRDIFLDGNTFTDSHSVDKNPLVGDIYAGFSIHYRRLKLSYARVMRTREFDEQDSLHRYGSLSLSWHQVF